MWFLKRISLRHAHAHRGRTLLAIAGVAVGASTVVATDTVTRSATRSFEKFVEALTGDADLHAANGTIGVEEELVEELLEVPGVVSVAPIVQGMATGAGGEPFDVFGVDLLGDRPWADLVPRAAVKIPDEAAFVSNDDSVIVAATFARARQLRIGSSIEVRAPAGRRHLVVRGTLKHPDLERLLGESFFVMDIPAAQELLAKQGRYDRIDLRVAPGLGASPRGAAVRAELSRRLAGRATVEEPALYGRNATQTLGTIDVMLDVTSTMTVLVGFVLIYHTIAVSVADRSDVIRQLRRIGVSVRALRAGFLAESAVLGAVAGALAAPFGTLLAWLSLGMFQQASSSWLRLPRPTLDVSIGELSRGMVVAVSVATLATMLVLRRALGPDVLAAQPATGGALVRTRPSWRLPVAGAATAVATLVIGLSVDGPLPPWARANYLVSTTGLMQLGLA
jgi:putative ABC transport system permease protein